jgi:hypothetical protein
MEQGVERERQQEGSTAGARRDVENGERHHLEKKRVALLRIPEVGSGHRGYCAAVCLVETYGQRGLG